MFAGRMFIVGLAVGPAHHYYYNFINVVWPRRNMPSIGKKILADQLIASPICIVLFFYTLGLLEGKKFSDATEELKHKFVSVYTVSVAVVWARADRVFAGRLDGVAPDAVHQLLPSPGAVPSPVHQHRHHVLRRFLVLHQARVRLQDEHVGSVVKRIWESLSQAATPFPPSQSSPLMQPASHPPIGGGQIRGALQIWRCSGHKKSNSRCPT
jgi:hypothetical protein